MLDPVLAFSRLARGFVVSSELGTKLERKASFFLLDTTSSDCRCLEVILLIAALRSPSEATGKSPKSEDDLVHVTLEFHCCNRKDVLLNTATED